MLRHHFWLLAAAALVLFTSLGSAALFDEDEPKNAACAREMLARGDWVVPTFNYELRTDKPVLLYWLMMGAYSVLGVNEFAARFWSAVLGTGTIFVTYHLGRQLFRPRVGLMAGFIMASSLMFVVSSRAATPDGTLIFFATLAMFLYVRSVTPHASDPSKRWQTTDGESTNHNTALAFDSVVPRRSSALVPCFAAMGMAVLGKGPVGVVLPLGVVALFVLIATWTPPRRVAVDGRIQRVWGWFRRTASYFAPHHVWQTVLALRLHVAVLVVMAVALPWYALVGWKTDGAWLFGFLGNHNLGRFVSTMENHRGPIVYYIAAIAIGFFPWSIFLTLSVIQLVRQIRRREKWYTGHLFLACWAGLWIGFFSLAGTKLPSYVLPAYPALALLTATFLDRWIEEPSSISRALVRGALGSLAVVGLGIMIAMPILAYYLLPGYWPLALVGLVPLIGGGYCLWLSEHDRIPASVVTCTITSLLFCVAMFGIAAPRVGRLQNSQPLVAQAAKFQGGAPRVATYDYFVPSLVFYAQSPVARYAQPDDVREFFSTTSNAYLITRVEALEQLRGVLPRDVDVLARQRRFLRRGEVVLLGRSTPPLARRDGKATRR